MHRAYVDECNVRIHKGKTLTPNLVIFQDMSALVLDSDGGLDRTEVNLVSDHLKEDTNKIRS